MTCHPHRRASRAACIFTTVRRGCQLLAGSLVLAAAASSAAPSQPVVVGDQTFALTSQMDGRPLRLNGVGVRGLAWVKGYAAGLYLPSTTADASRVLALDGPCRLQVRMLIDAPAEEFSKAFDKGVSRNVRPEDLPGLKERMTRFETMVNALKTVRNGDVVDLDFTPGTGLVLRHNGRTLGPALPGADLYRAMLAIFIGPKPMDRKMKAHLLGEPL